MKIKTKEYINEGFNSKAYIINRDYILLEGINKNSFQNYQKYVTNINQLNSLKSLQIPKIVKLISVNNEYPYGALIYEMIKGKTFREKDIKITNLENLAKKIAAFLNELYDIKIDFDKKLYINNEMKKMEESVIELKKFFNNENYEKIKGWSEEYKNYLLTFNDYHFIHGDLWYENYILDDNYELIGIVDFENSGMGDPANDICALNYLGKDFMDKVLY